MSDALQSKVAFVSADGEGGYCLKMQIPDGGQLVYPMDLAAAARLNEQCANAVAVLSGIRPQPSVANEKYFQK